MNSLERANRRINIVVDMNMSPVWVELVSQKDINAVHWSTVGDPQETDRRILDWALSNDFIVLTRDLDFGIILAETRALNPSVIQVRIDSDDSNHARDLVLMVLRKHRSILLDGAFVSIDSDKERARVLPLGDN
jgi:predicted nuclease of predicted toxin-antitoxin system